MTSISDLPAIIADLPAKKRARLERIFRVDEAMGELCVPETMRDWVKQHFGSVEEAIHQRIIRVTNVWTWEGALFNPLRGRRPQQLRNDADTGRMPADDVFAEPERTTSEDVFGRVRGAHCVTSSNISRWEGQCAVCIFNEPDPLKLTQGQARDYFRTSLRWAELAHQQDPLARNFIWMWNGGLKGGASVPHAHAQMALGRGMHYAGVESLRRAARAYHARHNADYFEDMLAIHEDISLDVTFGKLRGFFNLAALRSKDIMVYGAGFNDDLADALHAGLRGLIDRTGPTAFIAGVLMPPLTPSSPLPLAERLEVRDDWAGFPHMLRMTDRGPAQMISSDIGAIDVYAHRVITLDPYAVKTQLMETK
jgi:hypothetical protein